MPGHGCLNHLVAGLTMSLMFVKDLLGRSLPWCQATTYWASPHPAPGPVNTHGAGCCIPAPDLARVKGLHFLALSSCPWDPMASWDALGEVELSFPEPCRQVQDELSSA